MLYHESHRAQGFWANFSAALAGGVRHGDSVKEKIITQKSHPAFYKSFERLAKECGLEHIPHFVVLDEFPEPIAWIRKAPSVCATSNHAIIVNKQILKLTGDDLKKPASLKLKGILAHECSHLKEGVMGRHNNKKAAVMLTPLLAMIGLWIYDYAKTNTKHKAGESKKDYHQRLTKSIHQAADEEIAKIAPEEGREHTWAPDPAWQKHHTNVARYLLVGAVGLAGGLLAARHISLSAEFRADAMAVKIVKRPEIYKQIMHDVYAGWDNAASNAPTIVTFKDWVKAIHHNWRVRTIDAHPTWEKRVAHIDKVAREL